MALFQDQPPYSTRLIEALSYTADLHQRQVRKQGNVPYLCHLLQVAGLVLEAGGNEEETIAALLHDAIEDVGLCPDVLLKRWGETVHGIVISLTEDKSLPKDCRKQGYVQQVAVAGSSVILVSCADKLHNLRSYAGEGRRLWKPETAQFYEQLLPIYEQCERVPQLWVKEMGELIARIEGKSRSD